jgi:linoleoyl-CoA desaturase
LVITLLLGRYKVGTTLNLSQFPNTFLAVLKNKTLGKILRYSFDLCGVSSYMWRELHHAQHHNCINIDGEDETLVARKLLRFTKSSKLRLFHKFQHFYSFIVYGFFTADWVFTKDFECFFFPHTKYLKNKKHPRIEIIKLFVWKFLYIGYMILLPILWLGYSTYIVLLAFLVCHFLIGIIGGTIIPITHPLTGADFPMSRQVYDHYVYHVFATTADYAVNSRIADWFFGGLHLHVIHHLCPGICHIHYHELTKILKIVTEKYQINYRVNRTVFEAVMDHYRHMKSLSF